MRINAHSLIFNATLAAALILPSVSYAFDSTQYVTYQVKLGDTLSSILYDKFNMSPVYGRHGYIQQTVRMNEGKILKMGDGIAVGDVLLLPATIVAQKAMDRVVAQALAVAPTAGIIQPIFTPVPMASPTATPAPSGIAALALTPSLPSQELVAPTPLSPVAIVCPPTLPATILTQITQPVVPLAPVTAPATVTAPAIFQPFSRFGLRFGADYLALSGVERNNQTTATLLSGLSPKLVLFWQQVWSPKIASEIFASVQKIRIEGEADGLDIENRNLSSSELGASLNTRFANYWDLSLKAAVAQTLFYQGISDGGLKINQAPILALTPGLEVRLLEKNPFRVSAKGSLTYFGSSSYDNYAIQAGLGWDAGLRIEQNFASSKFDCFLHYGQRRQNTTFLNLTENRIGLDCGLGFGK